MSALVEMSGAIGKSAARTVSENGSVLFNVKWNPLEDFDGGGTEVGEATIEQKLTGLEFLVNSNPDTGISAYTGASGGPGNMVYADGNAATVAQAMAIINGFGLGQPAPTQTGYMTRWRAGLGDFRPGFVLGATTGKVAAAVNALIGVHDEGFAVEGDTSGLSTANVYGVGLGSDRAKSGGGQLYADHFESDYETDTSGNRFAVRDAARRREEQPGLAKFRVHITGVVFTAGYDSLKAISIYTEDNQLLGNFGLESGNTTPIISEAEPVVGPQGQALFVEGSGLGVHVAGSLSVSGVIRVA